jgi:hypothetical protein
MTIIAFDVARDELVGVRVNKLAQVKEEIILPNNRADIVKYLEALTYETPHLVFFIHTSNTPLIQGLQPTTNMSHT